MDAQLWIDKWKEGQIGFHKNEFNEALVKYFPYVKPQKNEKVLVPLCGKSKDLLWLKNQELNVHGVELYEKAAETFFLENNLSFDKSERGDFIDYSSPGITISCGDFFNLSKVDKYHHIYDRAALVALPFDMRRRYAKVISDVLQKGGKYLLVVYEYNQDEMSGPPFSVSKSEIEELYGDHFSIKLLESERPPTEGPKLLELFNFKQNIYLLEKN